MAKSKIKLPTEDEIQAERFRLQNEVEHELEKARTFYDTNVYIEIPALFVERIYKITTKKYEQYDRFLGYRRNYRIGVRRFIDANVDALATTLTKQRQQAKRIAERIFAENIKENE